MGTRIRPRLEHPAVRPTPLARPIPYMGALLVKPQRPLAALYRSGTADIDWLLRELAIDPHGAFWG